MPYEETIAREITVARERARLTIREAAHRCRQLRSAAMMTDAEALADSGAALAEEWLGAIERGEMVPSQDVVDGLWDVFDPGMTSETPRVDDYIESAGDDDR